MVGRAELVGAILGGTGAEEIIRNDMLSHWNIDTAGAFNGVSMSNNRNEWLFADTTPGENQAHLLVGEARDEMIYGSDGNDMVLANRGDDYVFGSYGNDILYGGIGFDILDYHQTYDSVILSANGSVNKGFAGKDLQKDFEKFVGGVYDDTFYAPDAPFHFDGSSGTDTVDFSHLPNGITVFGVIEDFNIPADHYVTANIEQHIGTNYDDRFVFNNIPDGSINGGDGFNTFDFSTIIGSLKLSNSGELTRYNSKPLQLSNLDLFISGNGNDTLSGSDSDAIYYGGSGNDRFISTSGYEQFYGEAGKDTFSVNLDAPDKLYINGGSDYDTVINSDEVVIAKSNQILGQNLNAENIEEYKLEYVDSSEIIFEETGLNIDATWLSGTQTLDYSRLNSGIDVDFKYADGTVTDAMNQNYYKLTGKDREVSSIELIGSEHGDNFSLEDIYVATIRSGKGDDTLRLSQTITDNIVPGSISDRYITSTHYIYTGGNDILYDIPGELSFANLETQKITYSASGARNFETHEDYLFSDRLNKHIGSNSKFKTWDVDLTINFSRAGSILIKDVPIVQFARFEEEPDHNNEFFHYIYNVRNPENNAVQELRYKNDHNFSFTRDFNGTNSSYQNNNVSFDIVVATGNETPDKITLEDVVEQSDNVEENQDTTETPDTSNDTNNNNGGNASSDDVDRDSGSTGATANDHGTPSAGSNGSGNTSSGGTGVGVPIAQTDTPQELTFDADPDNLITLSLNDLTGKTINDMNNTSVIEMTDIMIDRSNIDITFDGSYNVRVNDMSFSINASLSGGDFMTWVEGGNTFIQYQNFMHDVREGERVSDAQINGIVNQAYLHGDNASQFQVRFENDIGFAGYNNSLGAYEVNENGDIINVRLLAANTKDADTVTIDNISEGNALGFFLIQDGQRTLPASAFEADQFRFENTDNGMKLAVNDNIFDQANVFFTHDQSLNADEQQHVLSGIANDNSGAMRIGFEDMTRTSNSDDDFEDVVIYVDALTM